MIRVGSARAVRSPESRFFHSFLVLRVKAIQRVSAFVVEGRRKQVTQVTSSYLLPQVVIRVELLI